MAQTFLTAGQHRELSDAHKKLIKYLPEAQAKANEEMARIEQELLQRQMRRNRNPFYRIFK
ncbi:hypothetical protein SFC07_07320 [Corynebacterium callunae]|uniref:hypothetical protein n=1 Tax=Corynebacterium callunae TaxID=1721 RepID=UPI003981C637